MGVTKLQEEYHKLQLQIENEKQINEKLKMAKKVILKSKLDKEIEFNSMIKTLEEEKKSLQNQFNEKDLEMTAKFFDHNKKAKDVTHKLEYKIKTLKNKLEIKDQEAHFEVKLLIKKNKELEVKLAEERQKVESLKGELAGENKKAEIIKDLANDEEKSAQAQIQQLDRKNKTLQRQVDGQKEIKNKLQLLEDQNKDLISQIKSLQNKDVNAK